MAETTLRNLDIKDFTLISGVNTGDYLLLATKSGSDGKMMVGNLTTHLIKLARPQIGDNGNWVFKDGETVTLDTGIAAEGKSPIFKKGSAETAALLWKYENEDDSAYRPLVEWSDLKFTPADLTEEQWAKLKLNFSDLTEEDIIELQRPASEATQAALDAAKEAKGAAEDYKKAETTINQAVTTANAAKTLAEECAATAKAQKDETVSYLNTVKQNEAERVSAENARAKAETARATAEQNRAKAESARVQAETDRKNAWTAWFEDSTNGVKVLWTEWFTAAKNSFTSWFGATASEGIRGEVASWFTSAKGAWNSWFGTSSTTGVQGSWAALKSDATDATKAANDAAAASQKQTESCKEATDLAEELNAHPQMQGSNGNWWKWNPTTNEYEDTGIIARGGGMYPMVRTRRNHIIWYDSTDGFKERIVRRRNHTVIKL